MFSGILSPLRGVVPPIRLAIALLAFTFAFDALAQDKPPAARNFLEEFQQSLTAVPDAKSLTVHGTVYVPAYSSIRGRTDQPGSLATLLRIDNTSATKPLVLERVEYFDTSGKLIVIRHDNNFQSVYAHNREILVKEGQNVTRGQKIAEIGDTDADSPKLHFEIRKSGKPVDPMRYLPPS